MRRWTNSLVAVVLFVWSVSGTLLVPIQAQCKSDMVVMEHHAATMSHDCCQKKAHCTAAETETPECPMHRPAPVKQCDDSHACCAWMQREDQHQISVMQERSPNQEPVVLSSGSVLLPSTTEHFPLICLRDGARYERPVFDFKSDFRI